MKPVKSAKTGSIVTAYGWIMNWKSIRATDYTKIGEEYTIKTAFTRKIGMENISVYIGNVLVRDELITEKRHFSEKPVPLFIKGVKSGEKIYNNDYLTNIPKELRIEHTRRILYVFLKSKKLEIKIIDEVPPEILAKTGVVRPKMNFKQFHNERNKLLKKSSRAH